jgi:hypothetical protein
MITHVKFVGIPTKDQTRAFKFKQRWIELRIAHSQTRVVLFTPEGHESRIGSFFNGSLACDFTKEPEKQPWGTFAMFKDPDGNQFVLSSS